jgi:mRNA-degrading endonuclease RelE of RelBE toxin-antitoxin system
MTPGSEDEDEWTWKFAPRAADQFDDLDHHVQDRIVSKLDEVVGSEWRDPGDYLEPLTGGPFEKLRIGQYRLACRISNRRDYSLKDRILDSTSTPRNRNNHSMTANMTATRMNNADTVAARTP